MLQLHNQVTYSAILLSFVLSISNVSSFTPQQQQVKITNSVKESQLHHQATIFGWDEESDSGKKSFDEDNTILSETDIYSSSSPSHQLVYTTIANSLSHNRDKIASLARLAVAFSPPENAVSIEDIDHIHIIEVTNDHIELSAVVCDQSECITLLVPVTFPHDCTSSDDSEGVDAETCVLDNIYELDQEAQRVLKQRQVQHNLYGGKNTILESELMAELYSSNSIELPSWWITPNSYELAEECQHIKNILNQDGFQGPLVALATEGLAFCGDDGELFDIHRAVVSSLGPAGFYFRVIATRKDGSGDIEKQFSVIDIPYSIFLDSNGVMNNEITDPSTLRSKVLGAVASITGE